MRPRLALQTHFQIHWFLKLARFAGRIRAVRFPDSTTLPLPVYRDLVDALYDMWLPIFGLGFVFVGISVLAAIHTGDAAYLVLASAGSLTTIWRLSEMRSYRQVSDMTGIERLQRCEQRYAVGSYTFAMLLAGLNVRALAIHDPLLHLITVSLAFSFAAGIVSRISIRPKICVISLLLAAIPTIGALTLHALSKHSDSLHAQMFIAEAMLVTMITALSLQTVAHLYRSTIEYHTTRHDLALLAKYDALTGLGNRLLLRERFQLSMANVHRAGQSLALFFLDLDGFKVINDQHGHLAGDAILEQVAHRLEGTVRSNDTVARLGGDEFAVLQVGLHHEDEAKLLARRIILRLSEPYYIDGVVMHVSVSIGIAIAPKQGVALEELLSGADAALYRAKLKGKSQAMFWMPDAGTNLLVAA